MLEQLIIDNFAIIDHVDLQFEEGMTVLTGETGAGKSIIIDALSLLTGARASSEMVRHGAKKATLQAVFHLDEQARVRPILAEVGIDVSDGTLIIYREITDSGRSNIRVNGVVINLKTLAQIGQYLVDIQGQHDMQQLLNADEHLTLLDNFGGTQLQQARQDYQTAYQAYQHVTSTIRRVQTQQQEIIQRLDLLQFQQRELADAQLQPDEEEQLLEQRRKLNNHKKIAQRLTTADEALNQQAMDALALAMQQLNDIAEYDPAYAQVAQNVTESYYTAQEAGRDVSGHLQALTYDEQELIAIDDRLALIHNLERKYGATVADVLAFQQRVEQELSTFENEENSIETLLAQREQTGQRLKQTAQTLHVQRVQIAQALAEDVNQQLQTLLMTGAKFEVRLTPSVKFLPTGHDDVAFYMQTNVGEGMAPLVKIASGGEAARVMLALKTTFARSQKIISIVFDEADTGVSGRVAQAMAKKMQTISYNSQVLAITHLPQVAAVAQHHLLIAKHTAEGRTVTHVTPLRYEERIPAIAWMLSGEEITQTARDNAKALLDDAHQGESA